MSMTKEQQQALDDALVPREQRLTIGSCNYRLAPNQPKEPTFQVALDVLTLTPFYPAFLITASVPVVYMQEFIPQHEVVQRYGAILPDYLTNPAMKESKAYNTYHDLATGKVKPKPKYVCRSSRTKIDEAPKPSSSKRVKATAKVAKHDDDDERTKSNNDGDDFVHPKFSTHNKGEGKEESFDPRVQTPSHVESTDDEDDDDDEEVHRFVNHYGMKRYGEAENIVTHVFISPVIPEDNNRVILVHLASFLTCSTLDQIQVLTQYLLLTLRFDQRLKTLETEFSKFKQTNQFTETVSSILSIVDAYLANKMHEAVKTAVQFSVEEGPRESFDELMDTPLDFSAFMMNRLKIDTLTPELLAGPTFELMKGTCKSLVELEYFFEEVYKATTEQLDWHNPEGLQYPHDLRKPLPLIPNSRGRQVIPFDHFINNDLAYLSGGVSSRTYATSVTKTKAADYGHIKWIEDLVPNTIWSEVPVNYDKHALWGISHWGRKRQQFYGFAANRESARDVYSKRRIIAVTKLQIVEWHGYKHLDWITVRRDDNKLYTFKEGDFKRLRLQDIEDMLILLVQGKLTNLNVEDCLAFGVSLRMFTRSIVIQRRVEDLQLGFIYLNKDKKNRLMRIDELHKFSDGTLDDVRTALNDRLKGIKMEYLPKTI
ncbi:hypothetical protein Tco_1101933 [Tanacetum coccineum]